jgi:hypothetical protein
VVDLVREGFWKWPADWEIRFPILHNMQVPIFNNLKDTYMWKMDGNLVTFRSARVWDLIRTRLPEIHWLKLAWFSQCILKHSFMLWLVIHKKIRTQDKLRAWGIANRNCMNMMCCLLCFSGFETHGHLFFECIYTRRLWEAVCSKLSWIVPKDWDDLILSLVPFAASRSIANVTRKLCVGAVVYHVWCERNARFHGRGEKTTTILLNSILEDVWYRILGLKFRRRDHVASYLAGWGIKDSIIFDDGG